jgi:hypothetical protein
MEEKSLDELINNKYSDQSVSLSSKQIEMILLVFRNNIHKLRQKGMNKVADHREVVLRSIVDKLS